MSADNCALTVDSKSPYLKASLWIVYASVRKGPWCAVHCISSILSSTWKVCIACMQVHPLCTWIAWLIPLQNLALICSVTTACSTPCADQTRPDQTRKRFKCAKDNICCKQCTSHSFLAYCMYRLAISKANINPDCTTAAILIPLLAWPMHKHDYCADVLKPSHHAYRQCAFTRQAFKSREV